MLEAAEVVPERVVLFWVGGYFLTVDDDDDGVAYADMVADLGPPDFARYRGAGEGVTLVHYDGDERVEVHYPDEGFE